MQLDVVTPGDRPEGELLHAGDERDRRPVRPDSPRPSRAMDIKLRVFRWLVLDHMRQIGDIDPSGGHIGRHQKAERSLAHPRHDFLPGPLGEVGAQFVCIVAEALEDNRHIVHGRFHIAENDR